MRFESDVHQHILNNFWSYKLTNDCTVVKMKTIDINPTLLKYNKIMPFSLSHLFNCQQHQDEVEVTLDESDRKISLNLLIPIEEQDAMAQTIKASSGLFELQTIYSSDGVTAYDLSDAISDEARDFCLFPSCSEFTELLNGSKAYSNAHCDAQSYLGDECNLEVLRKHLGDDFKVSSRDLVIKLDDVCTPIFYQAESETFVTLTDSQSYKTQSFALAAISGYDWIRIHQHQ